MYRKGLRTSESGHSRPGAASHPYPAIMGRGGLLWCLTDCDGCGSSRGPYSVAQPA